MFVTKLAFEFRINLLHALAVLHLQLGPEMNRKTMVVCLPMLPVELVPTPRGKTNLRYRKRFLILRN